MLFRVWLEMYSKTSGWEKLCYSLIDLIVLSQEELWVYPARHPVGLQSWAWCCSLRRCPLAFFNNLWCSISTWYLSLSLILLSRSSLTGSPEVWSCVVSCSVLLCCLCNAAHMSYDQALSFDEDDRLTFALRRKAWMQWHWNTKVWWWMERITLAEDLW